MKAFYEKWSVMRSVEGKPGGVGTINTNEVEVMIVRGVGDALTVTA